ncbi:MAG: T9SS type A sorting domain-containing protein [Chitinophagales bacterium]|nr:T9SS type A sorting domain-containing protein [Chitinophagaceae bacterium]MCB9065090.1 T9SS type A sorting domain-containing protein [Chitinophagales bacterium]
MKLNKYINFKNTLVLSVLTIFAGFSASAQYCTPTFATGCGTGGSIQSVSSTGGISNITNNNTGCGNSTTSYSDYTGTSEKILQDALKTVDLKVTYSSSAPAASSALTRVYIDWNQNGVFEPNASPSEYAAPSVTSQHVHTAPGTSITVKITIPGQAKQGVTRMRVILGSLGSIYDPNVNPCGGTSNYGEAEDYNFEVINPCVPPNVVSTSNIDFKSVDIAWTPKLNAKLYEYLVKRDSTTPADTLNGFSYTTTPGVDIDTLACDMKYYVFVRVICDSAGISKYWDKSAWIKDSFTTQPCCYDPQLTYSELTSTTCKVKWTPIQTAYGYEYAVSTLPDPPQQGTYTTNTTIFLQGLPSRTTFFVHVRSRCSPTPLSGWSKISFKTLGPLSVNAVSQEDPFTMDVYPNPIQDVLTVQLNGSIDENAMLTVMDLTGKVVYTAPVSSEKVSVDVSNFANGVYVVKYTDDTHNEVMKVTKQ